MRARLFVLSLLTTAVVCFQTVAAHAVDFDRSFGPSPGGGYGRIWGEFNFTGTRAFDYRSNVQDRCPGDSLGVSMYFTVKVASQDLSTLTPALVQDTNGCGNGYNTGSGRVSRTSNIQWASVGACWTRDGNPCWATPSDGQGVRRDNPYT